MEPLSIISCVAAVISAFQSGSKIIQSIKAQRQARKAPPVLTELERSVEQAPGEIEAEKQKGVARFGRAFENGDYIAVLAIQQVTIDIQYSLLEKLRNATVDDTVTDFTTLADESDIGRNKIKSALFDLYQRLYQATKVQTLPEPVSIGGISAGLIGSRSSLSKEPDVEIVTIASPDLAARDTDASSKQQNKHKWAFSKLRRKSKSQDHPDRGSHTVVEDTGSPRAQQIQPIPIIAPCRKQSVQTPTFEYEPGEDDPFQIWGDDSSDSIAEKVQDANMHNRLAARSIQIPTPENNYLGFCKAAWKLQNGDRKALKMSNWAQNSKFKDYYFFCSNCSYYCRMNQDLLWNKVWKQLAPRGIYFRWSFLAKSHVPHKKSGTPDYSYLCLFCIFSGYETQPRKLKALFEHISAEHRGADLGEVVLNRTNCINDHICQDSENFDINLWPLASNDPVDFRKASLASTGSVSSSSTGQVWENVVRRVVDT